MVMSDGPRQPRTVAPMSLKNEYGHPLFAPRDLVYDCRVCGLQLMNLVVLRCKWCGSSDLRAIIPALWMSEGFIVALDALTVEERQAAWVDAYTGEVIRGDSLL